VLPGIGLTVLQFFFSILISGALLAKAQSAEAVARAFCNRLLAERGAEFLNLVGSTIRSVTSGILGVALIHTVLAESYSAEYFPACLGSSWNRFRC